MIAGGRSCLCHGGVAYVEGVDAGSRSDCTHCGVGINQSNRDGVVVEGGCVGCIACHSDETCGIGVAIVPLHKVAVGGGYSCDGECVARIVAVGAGSRDGGTHSGISCSQGESVLVNSKVSNQFEAGAGHDGGHNTGVGAEGDGVGKGTE